MTQETEQEVVVAKASVKGGAKVAIRNEVPTVRIRAGQAVTVAADYALEESSREKEEYGFTLRCQHARLAAPDSPVQEDPAGVRWDDRRGRHDSRQGRLRRSITFPDKGEFAIGWEVEAEYTTLPWGEHHVTSTDRKSAGGRIYVHVE